MANVSNSLTLGRLVKITTLADLTSPTHVPIPGSFDSGWRSGAGTLHPQKRSASLANEVPIPVQIHSPTHLITWSLPDPHTTEKRRKHSHIKRQSKLFSQSTIRGHWRLPQNPKSVLVEGVVHCSPTSPVSPYFSVFWCC